MTTPRRHCRPHRGASPQGLFLWLVGCILGSLFMSVWNIDASIQAATSSSSSSTIGSMRIIHDQQLQPVVIDAEPKKAVSSAAINTDMKSEVLIAKKAPAMINSPALAARPKNTKDNQLVLVPVRKVTILANTISLNASSPQINFCRRCKRTTIIELNNRSCVDEIFRDVGDFQFDWPRLLASIVRVSETYKVCELHCSPKKPSIYCPRMITTIWNEHVLGIDQVGPQVLRAVSHTLPAIPTEALEYRFDPSANEVEGNWTGIMRPLYTYNPTILPYSNTSYIATYRVSTHMRLPDAEFHNYLSVAILEANTLQILYNVVVDVNKHMDMGSRYKRRDDLGFSDFRLFHLNGTYVLSDNIYLLPLRIHVDAEEGSGVKQDDQQTDALNNFRQNEEQGSMPLVYGHGISIFPQGPVRHIKGLRVGRNYNFVALQPENGDGPTRIYVEEWPIPKIHGDGGREIAELLFHNETGRHNTLEESRTYRLSKLIQGSDHPQPALEGHELNFDVNPWRFSNNRGTACCVQLEREYYADLTANETLSSLQPYLLLGIAHVKSFKKLPMNDGGDGTYGYLSRFYAVLPIVPPSQVAAQSGLFCFPHVADKKGTTSLPIQRNERMLQWKNHTYDCPPVTFASGMTASLTDASKLIIAYGINDAVPNMVEVSKRDVALRLFSPVPVLTA